MAYFNQKMKQEKAPAIKAVLKKYGMKGSISVATHSTLCVTLTEGFLDLFAVQKVWNTGETIVSRDFTVNHYWIDENWKGAKREFFNELYAAMMAGNYNNSDIMSDYFDVGWYIDIRVGTWQKPYVCDEEKWAA